MPNTFRTFLLLCIFVAVSATFDGRKQFWLPVWKRTAAGETDSARNDDGQRTENGFKGSENGQETNSSNRWAFCCQLNKGEDRCIKEMRSYPADAFVPKGMKCWFNEKPPLSYVLFLKDYSQETRPTP